MSFVLSYPTCFVPHVLPCLTCVALYVFSCPTCSRTLHAFVPHLPRVSCVSCLTCPVPYMLLCPTWPLPHVPPAYVPHALSVFYLTCLVPNVLSCLTCLACSCTSLESVLRLIILIDSSKDTLSINDINTFYALLIATYVKNEFKNLQEGFTFNRRGLGYV